MRYGDCRWIDINAMDKERVVVVCPTAALEQHGHHLPLLTDTYLVTEVAERVERKLPEEVLLTPTLWLGASDHHLDFPGTVTVPNTLYVEMIKNVVRCYVKAGFRRILFLNGHGGNIAPGEVAITEMSNSSDECDGAMVAFSSYWTLAGPAFAPEQHGIESPEVTHACEYETSMMLAVHGDLVRLKDAKAGPPVIDSPFFHSERGGRVSLASRFHRLTPTGAMGQPQLATPAKGESLFSAAADQVAAFIEDFLTWSQPQVVKALTDDPVDAGEQSGVETTPADRARYFDSSNAFNIKYPPIPCHQFVEQRKIAFDPSSGTTMIPLDLGATLGLDYSATTPLILCRYIRICAGDAVTTRFKATGEIYYVCDGIGHSANGEDQVTWQAGDVFFLPGGRKSTHTAGEENCVLWAITNEPELSFGGTEPRAHTGGAVRYPAAEIQHRLRKVQEKLVGSRTPGLAVVFCSAAGEKTRCMMPSLHLAMNSLPPGVSQAPHRHNAVAVTLPIDGDGCYSIVAGKRVDWQRHLVMITPPADAHAHYNPGRTQATFLIVQDGGLYYHCRTMGFAYTDTPD